MMTVQLSPQEGGEHSDAHTHDRAAAAPKRHQRNGPASAEAAGRRTAAAAASAAASRRRPSVTASAVAANRSALLDAMRERCELGGAKLRPSFDAIVAREGVLSDGGRSRSAEGQLSASLRDHAEMAAMGRHRHRAGRSRGPRAATPKKDKRRRRVGETVVVPWEMRDQLDKNSEIVAAQEAPGLGDKSRILVKGRLRSDGREWWAPQVVPDDAPHSDQLSTERPMVFGFHDLEQRGRQAIDQAVELSRSQHYPHSPTGSSLQADSATWSLGVMEKLAGAPTTTLERMATTFDDMRDGPRLGRLKARASGPQARPIPTATELFEVLDAEARVATADDETNHWKLEQLPAGASTAGDSNVSRRTSGDDSDEDDDPLPSLEEDLGSDDPAELEPGLESGKKHGANHEPEPEPEPEPDFEPELLAQPEGNKSVMAAAGSTTVAAGSSHEQSLKPIPLAPFSDEEDEFEPDLRGHPVDISMNGADISPVVRVGVAESMEGLGRVNGRGPNLAVTVDEAGRFDDSMSLASFASSLPAVSTVSDFAGGSRLDDDSVSSTGAAEPYLRQLRTAGSKETERSAQSSGEAVAVATSETNELAGSRSVSDSTYDAHLSRVRRTSSHYQAISRLSSHTAASAAKRAERVGGPVVEREEYFADRSGRPDLFAEARQEYFSLVKDKQALAQAEGYDAPAIASPRNAFVENLIQPFRNYKGDEVALRGGSSSSATRAGRAAQAAREQRLAHTAALESGEAKLEEDLILNMLGPSVVDVLPELREHQLQVAPMPLLIGRDFPHNHTVALSHYRLGDTLGAAFASGLARLAEQVSIKKLLLSQCTLGPVGTGAIATAVSQCDSLTHLDLSNNPIGEQGAEALATVLEQDFHRMLRILELSKCNLSDHGASTVIRSVHQNPTLHCLDLRHNGIGRGAHAHMALAQLLTRNEALCTLRLGWNSIHGVRSDEFLNALRYNTHLEHLDLSWNTIGSRGASCIGWSLRFNNALLSIDLTHNEIGERGAFVLADTLQENSKLEVVTLDKNPLGQIGGAALLRGLRAYEALGVDRLIEIQQCNFDVKEYADEEMEQSLHESLHGRTFDPMDPAGIWVCNLSDPYGRAVANGLAELAWQEDEQNWDDEKTTLDGAVFDLPEPDRGIIWTRDEKKSILPEEGVLEIHYRSTLRRPRMSDVMAPVTFEALVVMMSDRTLTDHGMTLVHLAANNFLFSAVQVGSIVRHFPDAASRIEMVSFMLPQVVDQCNVTSEILDRLTEQELRGVEVKMGDFFYFVPSNPTGHYRLELGHRLARAQAMRLIEINCDEKRRRYGDLAADTEDASASNRQGLDADDEKIGYDVSERGDRDIFRNESITDSKTDPKTGKRLPGKRRRYNIENKVAAEGNLPKFGLLEFDVSSTNVDHLIANVDPMADDILKCLLYDLRLVKVFCATVREKTIKGPLLFQLATVEDKLIREKFQRARGTHHSIRAHLQSLRDVATVTAKNLGFLTEQAGLEALTHVKQHHILDSAIVQKVREAAEHAPLRLKMNKGASNNGLATGGQNSTSEHSRHDVYGRSVRDLNAAAAVEAFSMVTAAGSGSSGGASNSTIGWAKNSENQKMEQTALTGASKLLSKLTGTKSAAGYEETPTEILDMFAAVPHIAGPGAARGTAVGSPKPMKLDMLHQVISKIYEEKIKADAVADEHGRVRQSLPTFIVVYFQDQYGVRALAERHIGQLVAAVRTHAKPIHAFEPPSKAKKTQDESDEEEADNQRDLDPRVTLFGRLSGIVDGKNAYSACNVNFVMDLLGMLIVDHEDIDETLNEPDLIDRSLPLKFVEDAVRRNYLMRRQSPPEYLRHVLTDVSFMAKPGHLVGHNAISSGKTLAGESEKVVQQVEVDRVLLLALQLWLETMDAGERLLRETFIGFDKYEDGKLSFEQFLEMVCVVEDQRRVSKMGRPRKEVLAMYQQAMHESGGKSNKIITLNGFLATARQYNLGVPFVDPDSRQAIQLEVALGGAEDLEAEATIKCEEEAQEAMVEHLMDTAVEKAREGSEAPFQSSPRHDFLAAAKRKRDGRVAKAKQDRAKRLLHLESVDAGSVVVDDSSSHKKGHTRIVSSHATSASPRQAIVGGSRDGGAKQSRGSGRLVKEHSKYVLAKLNEKAQADHIVERRPCWWTPQTMSPHIAKDEVERVGYINHRMERLLRRATIEYFFTVAQLEQIMDEVPPSGKEAVLLVLFNRIVDPEHLKLDKMLPRKYTVQNPMHGEPVPYVTGVEGGNPQPVAASTNHGAAAGSAAATREGGMSSILMAADGTEHVAIREVMCGPEREEFIQCESGLWLPKIFLFRQPVGSSFKRKIGPLNLINPFLPDAMYERLDLSNHEDNAICNLLFELAHEQGDEYVDDKLRAWTFTRSGKARQYVSKMWANGVPKPTRPDLCSLQFRTRSSGMPPEAGANYEVRCSLARKLRMPGSGRWHAVPPKDAAPGQDTTAASFDDDDYGRQLELGDDGHLRLRLFAKEGLLR